MKLKQSIDCQCRVSATYEESGALSAKVFASAPYNDKGGTATAELPVSDELKAELAAVMRKILAASEAALGAQIVARAEFADHHAFSQADARGVLNEADGLGVRIVTTEKDWVRLAGGAGAVGELAARAWPLPIRLVFEPRDATRLAALIDAALIERRRA